ncbi:MAG: hypothetical protein M1812_006490 [Candelaria pacifica]|nr:MAG: hypothetical protein M1812_006490 [Candelaria pacifica]
MATSSNLPSLPVEVWARILQSMPYNTKDQLLYLWISCRPVSKFFKEEVEFIFRDRHLPKTFIQFQTDSEYPFAGHDYGHEGEPQCEWALSHISQADRSIAIFIVNEKSFIHQHSAVARRIMPQIIDEQEWPERLFEPQHIVQIRHEANDIGIPGLSVDYEKMEMSFSWRELYSNFFAEEKLAKILIAEKQAELDTHVSHLKGKNMDMQKLMMATMNKWMGAWEASKLEARRVRVRRQFKEIHGLEYDEGRDEGLLPTKRGQKNLMRRTQYVGLDEFSDEEDDEDDEDDEPNPDAVLGDDDDDEDDVSDEDDYDDGSEDCEGLGADNGDGYDFANINGRDGGGTNDGNEYNEMISKWRRERLTGIEDISD